MTEPDNCGVDVESLADLFDHTVEVPAALLLAGGACCSGCCGAFHRRRHVGC